jgi:hypothetical protein
MQKVIIAGRVKYPYLKSSPTQRFKKNSNNRSKSKTKFGRFLYQVPNLLFPVLALVFLGA